MEEQTRLKVIYGSADGFHAVDLDSATVYDIYLPKHVSLVSFCISNSIFNSHNTMTILTDSGSNYATLHRNFTKLKWYATTTLL